jgi:aminomuconate-semialdehyde/2-hydroxymuconate-6-semialdehyde dehydrogenase
MSRQLANFIDGEFRQPQSGRWLDVYEPATARVHAQAADSGPNDVQAASIAAQTASRGWAATTSDERAALLERIANRIEADQEAYAQAESLDSGKPIRVARNVDIPRAVANFRFFAAMARTFGSQAYESGPQRLHVVLRQALGAVACISPWNLPLYLLSWKVAPALAAGNTVVAKPSEITPLTASMLAQTFAECQTPPGVFNVLHGSGNKAGAPLVCDPRIKAVSFTGSTTVGRHIASATAGSFRKLSLELGGKNPTLVFADCDFDRSVREAVRAAFSNQGQICLCGSKIFVEKSIYMRFREAFLAQVQTLILGDPLHEDTDQGALVSKAHMDKVLGCIGLARAEGGRILTGGERVQVSGRCADGWFIAPTVIDQLSFNCRSNTEEIFGPVVTLQSFDNEAQAVLFANAGDYGLAASVWTRDLHRAQRLQRQLLVGLLWINCWMERDLRVPFGGMRQSGVGREGGEDAMRFFTEAKSVCIYNELDPESFAS